VNDNILNIDDNHKEASYLLRFFFNDAKFDEDPILDLNKCNDSI